MNDQIHKNILLTGASRGLGLTIAAQLITAGYTVYGISRNLTKQLEQIQKDNPDRLFLNQIDLTNTEKLKTELFDKFLPLDIPLYGFVNNAAIAYDDIITNLNYQPLEDMYRVNVFTPLMITKYVIRNMLLHNTKGSIVHISSVSAHTGYKGLAMYASTKGAIEAFSKNTAREWGARGIRSNVVVPGFMPTEMSAKLSAEQMQRIYNRTSLKTATTTQSVAATVAFLLSEQAHSITGQNIHVDSGTI